MVPEIRLFVYSVFEGLYEREFIFNVSVPIYLLIILEFSVRCICSFFSKIVQQIKCVPFLLVYFALYFREIVDTTWSFRQQFDAILLYKTYIKACTLNFNFTYKVTEIISEIRAPIVTVGVHDPAAARKKELKVNLS